MSRVLVAAPYPLTRAGLSALVEADPRMDVAGTVEEPSDLAERVQALAPDVVLVDPGDESDAWLEAIWRLSDSGAMPPVLLLSGSTAAAREALASGVAGLLLRDAGPEEIGEALAAVARGLVVIDRRAAEALVEEAPPTRPTPPEAAAVEPLTTREREILQLIAEGLPNKAIAAELGISEHTVKFHVGSILDKLGASSRSEALARAARLGLIVL